MGIWDERVRWSLGHMEIIGNKLADELANWEQTTHMSHPTRRLSLRLQDCGRMRGL